MSRHPSQCPSLPTVIGIDIGQRRDPTAVCVAQVESRGGPNGSSEAHYLVRFVSRFPLGMPYPEITGRLETICQRTAQKTSHAPEIFVDATGVGSPVVDLLHGSPSLSKLWAVTFTAGHQRTVRPATRRISVGKTFLVRRLQALLGHQRIHLPHGQEAQALAHELRNYEMRVSESARVRFGAFRAGTHDDLATALALAVQPPIRVGAS